MQPPGVIRMSHPECGGAAIIRFSQEHVRNALAPEDLLATSRFLEDCQHDPNVHVVFLTGSGRAFTSGFNLKALNSLPASQRGAALDTATELMSRIVMMPKPVIAAVNGSSAGLGNHIAICSDLCIVHRDARFHFTGSIKGIPSMQLGALVLPIAIGLKRAKQLLLRGGEVDAQQAVELGICNEVVNAEDWDSTIAALAREFDGKNLAVMAQNKYQMNQIPLQLLGALKLSSLAGGSLMAGAGPVETGRIGGPKGN